jgi:hypothetical protein
MRGRRSEKYGTQPRIKAGTKDRDKKQVSCPIVGSDKSCDRAVKLVDS